jgi:hypothetical protein
LHRCSSSQRSSYFAGWKSSRSGHLFQILLAEDTLLLGDTEQGRVELDEGRIDRRMLLVAGVAGDRMIDLLGACPILEVVECPATMRCVFDVDLGPGNLHRLRLTAHVDGVVALRAAILQHEHRTLRPGSGLHEDLVGRGVDEDVIEDRVRRSRRAGRVTHVQAGGKKDPLAVVGREVHLAIRRVGRNVRGWRGGGDFFFHREKSTQHE